MHGFVLTLMAATWSLSDLLPASLLEGLLCCLQTCGQLINKLASFILPMTYSCMELPSRVPDRCVSDAGAQFQTADVTGKHSSCIARLQPAGFMTPMPFGANRQLC